MFLKVITLEKALRKTKVTHYVKNDLHMPWQKMLHQRNRPLLKGFLHSQRQQSDVCLAG